MDVQSLVTCTTLVTVGKGLDLFSSWYASPNLSSVANIFQRKSGKKKTIIFNVLLPIILPLTINTHACIFVATVSAVMALRNLQRLNTARNFPEKQYDLQELLRIKSRYISLIPLACEVLVYFILGMFISIIPSQTNQNDLWYLQDAGNALVFCGFFITMITLSNIRRWRVRKKASLDNN